METAIHRPMARGRNREKKRKRDMSRRCAPSSLQIGDVVRALEDIPHKFHLGIAVPEGTTGVITLICSHKGRVRLYGVSWMIEWNITVWVQEYLLVYPSKIEFANKIAD